MDMTILADELADDPVKIGYAGMTDAEASDALNAQTVTVYEPVPLAGVLRYALAGGLFTRLRVAARTVTNPQQAALVDTVLALMDAPSAGVDTLTVLDEGGRPAEATAAMFASLKAAGITTDADWATLAAMAARVTSRAAVLGLGWVSPGDVQQAREGGY